MVIISKIEWESDVYRTLYGNAIYIGVMAMWRSVTLYMGVNISAQWVLPGVLLSKNFCEVVLGLKVGYYGLYIGIPEKDTYINISDFALFTPNLTTFMSAKAVGFVLQGFAFVCTSMKKAYYLH